MFETLDGLLTVTSLFKSRGTGRDVKMKVVEFFYFYLMPETSAERELSGGGLQRSPSKRQGNGARIGNPVGTKTTEEKQALLGRYLSNVEDLVEDLREGVAFGAAVV